MNTLEVKREALAKERIGNKYKSHKDCTFQPMKLSEIETADLPVREMTITLGKNIPFSCSLYQTH